MQKKKKERKKLQGRGIDWHSAFRTGEVMHVKQQALAREKMRANINTPKTNQLRGWIGFLALISKGLWVWVCVPVYVTRKKKDKMGMEEEKQGGKKNVPPPM